MCAGAATTNSINGGAGKEGGGWWIQAGLNRRYQRWQTVRIEMERARLARTATSCERAEFERMPHVARLIPNIRTFCERG